MPHFNFILMKHNTFTKKVSPSAYFDIPNTVDDSDLYDIVVITHDSTSDFKTHSMLYDVRESDIAYQSEILKNNNISFINKNKKEWG